ncbi:uncharacterized protein A4U43_C04F29520 [Asparagus officinalis]|uniref:Subtilisin-like protease fibronectin type-III domain-containing protein n=1 Tax=Asparagus officinalis TaxID=4686 RepID=A0A5P1F6C9_ASPOF|nr:uncharacterized protein A4U43_C04F29520 [Asparagus officinalis]
MALPSGTFAALNRPAASSKMLAVENLRTFTASFKGNGYGRRSLLSLVLLSTASTTSNASDSRTTLLQEYIKKSKENKARNDKEGTSINRFGFLGSAIPLVYGGYAANVSAGSYFEASRYCSTGSLDSNKVKNAIVLCDEVNGGDGVLMANGVGVIMSDSIDTDVAFSFQLPATALRAEEGARVLDYIKSTSNPIATIFPGETMYNVLAPRVADFSSRGPNVLDLDILKPDLTAPGVDILAAWSPLSGHTKTNYNVISGTSMSCPHVTGAAAYVKSAHLTWSPAAIKSALMTTANIMDSRKNEDAEFAYGAGHINPLRALSPGLIFDTSEQDYVDFLCNRGYNTTTVRLITGDSSSCPNVTTSENARNLNYPSFALAVVDNQPIYGVFRRTVTNVGPAESTYQATVYETSDFTVDVSPSVLYFSYTGEVKTFAVTIKGGTVSQKAISSGSIVWRDGSHEVRTPIAVYTVLSRQTPLSVMF